MSNKKNKTYQDHLNNMVVKKESLPFHKMDDVSRRKFISNVGYFLTAFGVTSMIRLETMSKISKRLFGSSTAYAAIGANDVLNQISIQFAARAGYGFVPWVVGAGSDYVGGGNDVAPADRNVAWDQSQGTANNVTGGLPVVLPPHSSPLIPFVNGIQAIQSFRSNTGHMDNFQGTNMAGVGEICSLRVKSEFDAGREAILTQPFGYFNPSNVGLQNVPAALSSYAPAAYSSISAVYNLFTPPTLTSNQGTTLSNALKKNVLSVMQDRFGRDVENALYEKDKDLFKTSTEQAFKMLATNYQQALNPDDPANAATLAALQPASPQTRMGTVVNPARALFQIMTAACLGITTMGGHALEFNTGDWHSSAMLPSGDGAGDARTESARFVAELIGRLFTTVNGGFWEDQNGNIPKVTILCTSEFSRTNTSFNGDDNGDGQNNATLVLTNSTTPHFRPGSYGKIATNGSTMGFNPSNDTHSTNIQPFTSAQSFVHNAKLFGVDPTDFGVNTQGLGSDMVDD